MCILILSATFVGIHVKYPVFLSDFNETWTFLTDFREILKYHMSSKFVFRADGHDETNIICLSQFCERV